MRLCHRVRYQAPYGLALPPPALSGGPWRVPAHPPVRVAWYCGLCKGWRRVGVRAGTRATGAQRMWGPAGALGSTEGQRPRGPRVRVRGRMPPRCAGARPPPPCACAGPREVRARGTRPPGRTARTCWRLSTLLRTQCHILAESAGVWEVGGRRPRVEEAEPEVVPPLSEGVPDTQQAGPDAAPVVPAKRLPLDLLPRVVGENPVSWKAAMRSSHAGRGCPWGGVAMYTWRR